MNPFKSKIEGTVYRIEQAFALFPKRVSRMWRHLSDGILPEAKKRKAKLPVHPSVLWWVEFFFLLVDVFALPEFYEDLAEWAKWKTRSLTAEEAALAKSVFGDSLDYRRIRVDETARIACRTHHIYYVSFHTINAWGELRPDIFIHELVHVWQFQHLGSPYIPRALLAQKSEEGYDYGGPDALRKNLERGGSLLDFNFEQQADIIADGFCLRQGLPPNWAKNDTGHLPLFEKYLAELRRKEGRTQGR